MCSQTLYLSQYGNICAWHLPSNTTILLANYWKVYNYMFRPYSWAIIRFYHEPIVGYITCYLLVMGVLESSTYYCVLSWYVYFFILCIIIFSTGINCRKYPTVTATARAYKNLNQYKVKSKKKSKIKGENVPVRTMQADESRHPMD